MATEVCSSFVPKENEMVAPKHADEIAREGEAIYQRNIRREVESGNRGRFVVIDVLTGDFEIADEDLEASDRILERRPQAVLYGIRIGSPTAYRIGFIARPVI
jgi:hypothetical protein